VLLNLASKMFLDTHVNHKFVPQAENDWVVDVAVAAGTAFASLLSMTGHSNATVNVKKMPEL